MMRPPNTRVQRTRSSASPSHSPLTRRPLGSLPKVAGHRRVIAALLAVALARGFAVGRESPEPFERFLERFVADKGFRYQRTHYPLIAKIGNQCEEDWKVEKWSKSKTLKAGVKPLSASELATDGLTQRITKLPSGEIEVFQFRDEADSYLETFRFTLHGTSWYLTYFEDGSC